VFDDQVSIPSRRTAENWPRSNMVARNFG